jgi:molybdopterin synthase catalytic subunit
MQLITEKPIDLNHLLSLAHHPEAGAIVLFSGEARMSSQGKQVEYLEYEAFVPLAEKMMAEVLESAIQKWNLKYATCIHRIGKVGISEPAVCVITASPHRKEAYLANQYIIHKIKHEAPIWKKEVFSDGSYEWGGNCHCKDPHHHEEFDADATMNINTR